MPKRRPLNVKETFSLLTPSDREVPNVLYNEDMYKDRTPSDSELILGSFFVVCILFTVNLLGSESPRQIVMTPAAMSAAVPATASKAGPSAAQTQAAQSCMKEVQNTKTSYGKDYECLPGCTYTVKIGKTGGSFFERNFSNMVEIIPSGKPSQTKEPPGQVKYVAMFGSTSGPFACDDTVVGTAQNKFPDLRTSSWAFHAGTPEVQVAQTGGVQIPSNKALSTAWQPSQLSSTVPNADPFGGMNPAAGSTNSTDPLSTLDTQYQTMGGKTTEYTGNANAPTQRVPGGVPGEFVEVPYSRSDQQLLSANPEPPIWLTDSDGTVWEQHFLPTGREYRVSETGEVVFPDLDFEAQKQLQAKVYEGLPQKVPANSQTSPEAPAAAPPSNTRGMGAAPPAPAVAQPAPAASAPAARPYAVYPESAPCATGDTACLKNFAHEYNLLNANDVRPMQVLSRNGNIFTESWPGTARNDQRYSCPTQWSLLGHYLLDWYGVPNCE